MTDVKQPRLQAIGEPQNMYLKGHIEPGPQPDGLIAQLRELHENGDTIGGYIVGRAEVVDSDPNIVPLDDIEQRYLEQLNMEVLYAQKAYFGFLNHLRRVYGCPEGEWAMNNINVGFERIEVGE